MLRKSSKQIIDLVICTYDTLLQCLITSQGKGSQMHQIVEIHSGNFLICQVNFRRDGKIHFERLCFKGEFLWSKTDISYHLVMNSSLEDLQFLFFEILNFRLETMWHNLSTLLIWVLYYYQVYHNYKFSFNNAISGLPPCFWQLKKLFWLLKEHMFSVEHKSR